MHRKPNSGHKLLSRILAGLLVLMFVLTLASQIFLYAFAIDQAHYDRLEELQAQQSELEAEQATYESTLATLADKKDKLAERVLLCNDKIDNYVSQIETAQALIDQYTQSIAQLEEELADTEVQFDVVCELCSIRLESLALFNKTLTAWRLVFTNDDLATIDSRLRAARYLVANDAKLLTYLSELKVELNDKRTSLQNERDAQNAELKKLNERREKLEKASKDYKKALKTLNKEWDSCSDHLNELIEARGDIGCQIQDEEDLIRTLTEEEEAQMQAQIQAELEEALRREEEEAQRQAEEAAAAEEEEPEEDTSVTEEPASEAEETGEEQSHPSQAVVQKPSAPVTSVPSPARAQKVIAYAEQFLGNPYVWGGESLTNGCDCSGFVMLVYAHFGIFFEHQSAAIRNSGIGYKVSIDELLPGDIVCYDGHVGIYVGDDMMINALSKDYGIVISSIYKTNKKLLCGLRVL